MSKDKKEIRYWGDCAAGCWISETNGTNCININDLCHECKQIGIENDKIRKEKTNEKDNK